MKNITSFVTFYSYKGGVGRTSALVNSAIMRANSGNRVVIIDFDLEAPGVGAYLSELDSEYNSSRPGILEYLTDYLNDGKIQSFKDGLAYDFSSKLNKDNDGQLWVISAGDVKDQLYPKRLDKISWETIFREKQGELLLKNLKKQIENEFSPDYVFIDSRTGITETGGVCTKYLADKVVVVTSLNEQNINGTSRILKDLGKKEKDLILVASNVPVGMPTDEDSLLLKRFNAFEKEFSKAPDVVIYNYPTLSLSEALPVKMSSFTPSSGNKFLLDNDPLYQSYSALSRRINRISTKNYFHILSRAREDLFYYYGTDTEETYDYYELLLESYSGRLFVDIFKKFKKFLDTFRVSKIDFDEINYKEFDDVIVRSSKITNNIMKRALDDFKRDISMEIIKRKVEVNSDIARFVKDERILTAMIVTEMSKGRFEWPHEALTKLVECTSPDINDLFNFAWCRFKLGYSVVDEFKAFLNNLHQVEVERLSTSSRVNFYACVSIAFKEIGENAKFNDYQDRLNSSLASYSGEVFSPFTYKEETMEDFKKQLEEYL